MEDALKPFYTGWNTGDQLAQQDNARYTQFANQALSNTGIQNREMLGHINDMHTMALTGYDRSGKPLDPTARLRMVDFVSRMQSPFSQGVYAPLYDQPKDATDRSQWSDAPVAPTAPTSSLQIPQMYGPQQPPPLQFPQMQQQYIAPENLTVPSLPQAASLGNPQMYGPQQPTQGSPAPVAPRKTTPVTTAPKKRALVRYGITSPRGNMDIPNRFVPSRD